MTISEKYNLIVYVLALQLYIYSFETLGTTEHVTETTTSSINYTYQTGSNGLIISAVHIPRNKSYRDSKNLTSSTEPGGDVTPGYSTIEDLDAHSSSPSQYNLTWLSTSDPTSPSSNSTLQNVTASTKPFKEDELAQELVAKIRYYLKYLDSINETSSLALVSVGKRRSLDTISRTGPEKRLAFIDKMLEGYDKRAWPTYGTDVPTKVRVNIYINTLGPVNAAQMEYGMDIYLRQLWNDPRLRSNKYGVKETVTLNAEEVIQSIWKPDIFFKNIKKASFHKVTVPNKLLKITPEGNILYSMRITMSLACHMSFRHYPLDCQRCQLIFGSYAQTTDQVLIDWQEESGIVIEQALELNEFDVTKITHGNFIRDIDTGSFSFLNVTFVLVRQNGFHLIQTYMPTFLIVMISWVSFWLNVDATPARVTLGVTTLLTLTTVAYGVRLQLPPVSYIKAIDIWIGACSVMVFGALLEFTLVNYLSRSKIKLDELKQSINIFHWNKKFEMARDIEEAFRNPEDDIAKNLKRARYVDRFCRIIFPLAFFAFNIAYWLYYLYIPDTLV